MRNKIEFDFGYIEIDGSIVTGVMNEGSHIDIESNNQLLGFCDDYFNDQAFGYISHRIHSYSVDPTVYLDSESRKNLIAIAVVMGSELSNSNFIIEKQFFKQPFELFETFDEAKEWLIQIIPN